MKLIYICVNVPLTVKDRKFHVDFTNEYRGDIHYFGAKTFGICGKIKVNGNHTMGLSCCLQHFLFNSFHPRLGSTPNLLGMSQTPRLGEFPNLNLL